MIGAFSCASHALSSLALNWLDFLKTIYSGQNDTVCGV